MEKCVCIKVPVTELQQPEKTALAAMVQRGYKPISTLHIEENGQEQIMFVMTDTAYDQSIWRRFEVPVTVFVAVLLGQLVPILLG